MQRKNNFITSRIVRSPVLVLFIGIYLIALGMAFLKDLSSALAYTGMSIGVFFLIWLAIGITEKLHPADFEIRKPARELLFGLLIVVVWSIDPLRYLYLSIFPGLKDKWDLLFMVKKNLLLAGIPMVFLLVRKNSLSSMGMWGKNWKKNTMVGVIIFSAMAIPSAFYSGTAGLILDGKMNGRQILLGFPISFIHSLLMSGFSEEFLFRAFLQTRFSVLLKSRISGVAIVSLLFGMLHIPGILQWYPGTTLSLAFCRAFFIQTLTQGVILGVLWARTRNLLPCIFLHSGINGLNNLSLIISRTGL